MAITRLLKVTLNSFLHLRPPVSVVSRFRRANSSRSENSRSNSKPSHSGTEAAPFQVTPAEALEYFRTWQRGVLPFATGSRFVSIQAVYCPFWAFNGKITSKSAASRHLPADARSLLVYSGASLPRPMAEVIKCPARAVQPFQSSMLELEMQVHVEPFVLYESTAWNIALSAYAAETFGAESHDARVESVTSRRLLLPAYVCVYSTFGVELRAIVNGYTGQVWGVQQEAATARVLARTLSNIQSFFGTHGSGLSADVAQVLRFQPQIARAALALLLPFMRGAVKILFFPPILAGTLLSLGGLIAHATFAPYSQQRRLFQQWEATRSAEARMQAALNDEWKFREDVSNRRQRAQPRDDPQVRQQHPQFRSQRSTGMPPPVNEKDYYAVLGLSSKTTTATTEEVQAAFRRELLKYHPDHAAASGLDVKACSQRTAHILAAYSVLRDAGKRAVYDAEYSSSGRRRSA